MSAHRIRYVVLYYWDELSEMYVATVPDMPESKGQGMSITEALASVRTSMEGYLQALVDNGIPLPEPRHLLSRQVWVTLPENARTEIG